MCIRDRNKIDDFKRQFDRIQEELRRRN